MAITHVRSASGSNASALSTTITMGANMTVGNLVVVGCSNDGGKTFNTPSDTAGNTYTALGVQVSQGTLRARLFYTIVTGAATVITIGIGGATPARLNGVASEFAASSPLFQASPAGVQGSGTGTTEVNLVCGSFAPVAGNLVVAFATNTAAGTYTAGTSYTIGAQVDASAQEYRLSGTTSETAPISTNTAGTGWIEVASEFLLVVTAAAYPVTPRLSLMGFGAL